MLSLQRLGGLLLCGEEARDDGLCGQGDVCQRSIGDAPCADTAHSQEQHIHPAGAGTRPLTDRK